MAELRFDREPGGTPYDREQELTQWLSVGTVPTSAEGDRFPARAFTAGGYRATDGQSRFLGLQGISAHFVLAPDYGAPETRQALLYRGHGGPTAAEYWAWGFEVERSGGVVTVYAVHQNQAGGFVEQEIGTYDVGAEWIALAVSREVTPGGFHAIAWIDGQRLGEVVTPTDTAATPGQPVSLGCRLDQAEVAERIFQGRMERVLVKPTGTTDAEVSYEYAALLGAYPDAYDTWSSYLPSALARTPESAYGRYRVRPMAEVRALFDAACQRWQEAALPPTAFGVQLATLEAALSLTPRPTDTIAARQAAAQAALAGIADLGPAAMQSLAAALFGTLAPGVEILEGRNYWLLPLSSARRLAGAPWHVRGPADVYNDVTGLTIDIPAGRDLRYQIGGDDRAVFVELAIAHDPVGRETDHGMAVSLGSASGLQEDTWAGLALVDPQGNVGWLAVDSGGLVLRSYDRIAGLSGRIVVDVAAAAPLELVLEWHESNWVARWRAPGAGPYAWAEYVLPWAPGAVTWIGLSVASALPSTLLAVELEVSAAAFKAGDSPAWAYWQALETAPVNRDIVAHTVELDRKSRASASGAATYTVELVADTDGSAFDCTPTTIFGPRLAHIGDTASDAAQSTGLFPDHLWTFQESGSPVVDQVGDAPLSEPLATIPPTYQADGPVDRDAVAFAANNNALQAADSGSLDVAGNAVVLACILRIDGDGLVCGKEQSISLGWTLSRSGAALVLRLRNGLATATASLTDASSGFVAGEWFALVAVIKDDGGTGRVWLATSQGSAQGSTALVTTNAGKFGVGAGASGNAAPARVRWLAATVGGEADSVTFGDVEKIAARLAAAAGVA